MHRNLALLLFVYAGFLLTSSATAVTIPTVPVGNPGNASDPTTGRGAVAQSYRIGTTEVTVGQYTEFLNAIAKTDTYGLYDTAMATDLNVAGISRIGAAGSYTYEVIGSPNKPVTYVNWGDAARFTNWLNNGQPSGAQTSGTTEDGAYALNGVTGSGLNAISRKPDASWFLPTDDQWYKAAYHQPAASGGDLDSYWGFPTQSNIWPASAPPPGLPVAAPNIANFRNGASGYAVTGSSILDSNQNYLTDAGAYSSARNFYGTFDQAGNVWEWTETAYADLGATPNVRILRGGSWVDYSSFGLFSQTYLDNFTPNFEGHDIGFRVASVPEPGAGVLAIIAAIFGIGVRKRW